MRLLDGDQHKPISSCTRTHVKHTNSRMISMLGSEIEISLTYPLLGTSLWSPLQTGTSNWNMAKARRKRDISYQSPSKASPQKPSACLGSKRLKFGWHSSQHFAGSSKISILVESPTVFVCRVLHVMYQVLWLSHHLYRLTPCLIRLVKNPLESSRLSSHLKTASCD